MSDRNRVLLGVLAWTVLISGLYLRFNLDWAALINDRLPESERKLNVAYIPVT